MTDTLTFLIIFQITVNVIDINDESPVFTKDSCKDIEISENIENKTVVATVKAIDKDTGNLLNFLIQKGNFQMKKHLANLIFVY